MSSKTEIDTRKAKSHHRSTVSSLPFVSNKKISWCCERSSP